MTKKINFIDVGDNLSQQINDEAGRLYSEIKTLNVDSLEMDPFCRNYFKECHSGRLIFSLRCSAHIIYESVKLQGAAIHAITFVDYGAGLGTLFMLAARLPFKAVIYNDHLKIWCTSASVISERLNLKISHFIEGDIDELISFCKQQHITPDIISSRNVIEHIYNLNEFFSRIGETFPGVIVYSTTTANLHNPAMHLKHILLHRSVENKYFIEQRKQLITARIKDISQTQLDKAIRLTRGKALKDFDNALDEITRTGTVMQPRNLRSNTCDSITGVWAEHLLSKRDYEIITAGAGFTLLYQPGFWDVNYKNAFMNIFSKIMNSLIRISGDSGVLFSPFVSVIAVRRKK